MEQQGEINGVESAPPGVNGMEIQREPEPPAEDFSEADTQVLTTGDGDTSLEPMNEEEEGVAAALEEKSKKSAKSALIRITWVGNHVIVKQRESHEPGTPRCNCAIFAEDHRKPRRVARRSSPGTAQGWLGRCSEKPPLPRLRADRLGCQ